MSEHIADRGARIVDRGYQHYGGARLGQVNAMRVMVWAAARRGLGLRRPARAKILPWLLIVTTYAPTLFIVIFQVLTRGAPHQTVPTYGAVYQVLEVWFVLFAGLSAPDLLCADRRERVLSLYFASPITRLAYIAAQVVGLTLLLLLLTLVPFLLRFAGDVALATSAPLYLRDHLGELWHIVLSGGVFALYYGAVALAVASFTDRRAYATGAYLGLMLVSSVVARILTRILRFSGHEWVTLADLIYLPQRIVRALFGEPVFPSLNAWTCAGVALGVVVVSLTLVCWRYLRVRD